MNKRTLLGVLTNLQVQVKRMYFLLLAVAIAVVHGSEALSVDCATVSCLLPTCAEGEISVVPEGECCPICVPDTRNVR